MDTCSLRVAGTVADHRLRWRTSRRNAECVLGANADTVGPASPEAGPFSLGARHRIADQIARVERVLRRLDPNDDPTAEKLSIPALLVLAVAISISAWMYFRWRVQPMQDLGHHVAFSAIVADYGKAGSIYPAIYKPFDFLNTNSLLYSVAGNLGKILPTTLAFRLTFSTYLIGVPLATLWALRVFGRSAWGAVLAVPACYNCSYVYGFANFLFAAPMAILAIPLFYRMIVRPTKWRVLGIAALLCALFLAHLHVFLWTGVLLFVFTIGGLVVSTRNTLFGRQGTPPWAIALTAAIAVIPSLLLCYRYYRRATSPAATDELALLEAANETIIPYADAIRPVSKALIDLQAYLELIHGEEDMRYFAALGVLGVGCVALARLDKWKRPPILELACMLTLGSYFVIPENWAGQAVIGSRQVGFAIWFAPALFTPVALRVSVLARSFAIASIVGLTWYLLSFWHTSLVAFEKTEAFGFDAMMRAAPPQKKMHYVNGSPNSSVFILHAFWHIDKWYMADKRGQCDENPAWATTQAIRYRKGYPLHRVTAHGADWSSNPEIWDNYDLVLVRDWHPAARDLENANKHGRRLVKQGKWELWEKTPAPLPSPP